MAAYPAPARVYSPEAPKGDHTWVSETTSATLSILPLNSITQKYSGAIAGAGYYYDTQTGASAPYYTAAIQYKLGECKQTSDPKSPQTAAAAAICTIRGSSAISFEYDYGTNKDMLVKTSQYLG